MLNAGVLPSLVQLLYHTDPLVITPALRTIGNIVTGGCRLLSVLDSQFDLYWLVFFLIYTFFKLAS